jgi:hypothetical protein
MKILIYTILVLTAFTFSIAAQTPAKPGSVLHVEVENDKSSFPTTKNTDVGCVR